MAKEYCRKVFFTFHLPYLTCYKNDFRYNGITDCNNFFNPQRCVRCIIATRFNYQKNGWLSPRNISIDLAIPVVELNSKARKLKKEIILRQSNLNELINVCDHLFIYASWFKDLLKINGYNDPSIKSIPYITKTTFLTDSIRVKGIKKKILFVGRVESQKGLHLLCKAMNLISIRDIQLDVFGNVVDEKYFDNCAQEFPFTFKKTLPFTELLKILPEYDFLVLPSLFTEMYSMIAKNAFYEQLPVIASAAKGNVDMIEEGKNGFIFEYDNYEDLARVIDQAYHLKERGWMPQFETNNSTEDDEREILSYFLN
jgi:glycosyltransferase involved in cell wall biosynthesis